MKAKLILTLVFLRIFISAAYAEGTTQTRRCTMMAAITADVVNDRDNGMGFESRLKKNEALITGASSIRDFISQMTDAVYHGLKGRTKQEITNTAFSQCIKFQW